VSYSDQGTFSFALWPFSIRLLWAPIVDSLSITRIGRRKTWVVGCFIAVGLILVSFAQYVHNILQADREKNSTDIYILTLIFGTLVFLIATQDIALDAWSLDLLMQ
jgi:PAT family acetyl-CoA transporter-like MFS transporter 1